MADYKDQVLAGRVSLDGNRFENCEFAQVELTYAGGPPPAIINCRFNDATFTFTGPANATLLFLRSMAAPTTGLRPIIDGLMPELTQADPRLQAGAVAVN